MTDPRKRWLKRLALMLFAPVIVFLIVELAMRVYFRYFGTEADRFMYLYSAEEITQNQPAIMGLPFVNSGPSPDYLGHNQLGFRGPEIEINKPPGTFRILANGGSTTYGAGLEDDETWPSQLQRILHEKYGYTQVEVINTGSVGYTTWNSLASLAFRELDLQPDLLIVYHGTNDVRPLTIPPQCYSGKSVIRGLSNGLWRLQGPPISPSVAFRFLAVSRGWMPNPADYNNWVMPAVELDPQCGPALPLAEGIKVNKPIYFERNLRNMVYLARGSQVNVVFSTWGYYPHKVDQPASIEGYALLNDSVRKVASELNVPLYDLITELPDNPDFWYFDGEHQTPLGARTQAELYADWLVKEAIIPPPQS